MTYQLREDDYTQELTRELDDADITELRTILRVLGNTNWIEYLEQHQSNIQLYLCASPAQRWKQRSDGTHQDWLLTVMGAIWSCQLAQVMYQDLQSPALESPRDNPGRRAARGQIGITVLNAVYSQQIGWPFASPSPWDTV